MRSLLLALLPLSSAFAAPGPKLTPDARGVFPEVRAGGRVFLTDMGVSLTAPGWNGHRGDQRAVAPDKVTRTMKGGVVTLTGTLEAQGARTRFREVVRPVAGGARLEYELTPETDVAVENVLLLGRIPVEGNAGRTRWVAAAEDGAGGTLEAELAPNAYRFFNSAVDWLALVAPDGSALRVAPEGMVLALQDDRKFGVPSYGLQATVEGARTLKAGIPVRFALEITGQTAAQVDAATARARQGALAGVPLAAKERLRAGKVAVDHASVGVFERVELTPDVAATFDNPFDPDDVAVDAAITLPDGKSVSVPGFYTVPFRVETVAGRERLRVTGPPQWKVRFTPTRPGRYAAVVRVRDRSGEARCPAVRFTAAPSKRKGFVRVSTESPGYFRHDDGTPYFAVGENVCWSGASTPVQNYTEWFRGLGGAGANWARLWLAFNEKGLEWMPAPTPKPGHGSYLGLGRYALDNAWRLDEVVRLAEENGIRVMFCLGTYGELMPDGGYFSEGSWSSNPYNAANGGPCRTPEEFWTNPTARKLYQRRLRYLVARWGYAPQLFAWEFWNEKQAPAAWVGEMAAYLKAHDVNRHLVSTTYGDDAVWKLPDVDFTMTHRYGDDGNVPDFTADIARDTREHRKFAKPYLLAEFGIDWRTSDSKYDPEGKGQNLHDGLWAGMMSGGAGTAMLWYWDGYVHPKNLYHVFAPAAEFASRVDWSRTRFEPLEGIRLARSASAPERFTDLEIAPGYAWGRQGEGTYTVRRDGSLEGGPMAGTVGSPTRHTPSELHTRLTFHLDMPAEGQFVTLLGTVSSHARLRVTVDGAVGVDDTLEAGEGQGPWKASRYLKDWKVWQSDYDREYRVPVPAGRHTVTIENAEGDWLSLRGIRVTGYRSDRYPQVDALGLRSEKAVLLWLHHRQSTWRAVLDGKQPEALSDLRATLSGLPDGAWRVEWWDTYTGAVIRTDAAVAKRGEIELAAPAFARDVAAVVRYRGR